MDDLFNKGLDMDWAIVGSGVRPHDSKIRDTLQKQDFLTTIVELQPGANTARVTSTLVDFLPVETGNCALAEALSAPWARIVSLTITEGGYFIDPATGEFDPDCPEMVADAENPNQPMSVFGALVLGLKQRRKEGVPPFTLMSCDNLPGNGDVTKKAVVGLAQMTDNDLARWIEGEVAFPNGMVDRITPATTEIERERLLNNFSIVDKCPVFCEPFRQWVLEDHFPMGRPSLEEVGVTFTSKVSKFELMKIRILNGGHAAIAYPAALLDIHFVHEAMSNTLIKRFLVKLEKEEIIPLIPPVPDTDLIEYFNLVQERFSNQDVGDTIPRLCQDGSNRQPKFILPSIRDRLNMGFDVRGLALEIALWCRYCSGESESRKTIFLDDENSERLRGISLEARCNPAVFLGMQEIFGDLGEHQVFRQGFSDALNSLWSDGVEKTLDNYLLS
jgi:mannitol 2-dehydrogenase